MYHITFDYSDCGMSCMASDEAELAKYIERYATGAMRITVETPAQLKEIYKEETEPSWLADLI